MHLMMKILIELLQLIIWVLILFQNGIDARLHIPFMHAFTALHCIFYYLPWFVDVYGKKVITSKMQCNAENACGNWMWQRGLTLKQCLFFACNVISWRNQCLYNQLFSVIAMQSLSYVRKFTYDLINNTNLITFSN